jgi:hypothetical protein
VKRLQARQSTKKELRRLPVSVFVCDPFTRDELSPAALSNHSKRDHGDWGQDYAYEHSGSIFPRVLGAIAMIRSS